MLSAAVVAVAVARRFRLPSMLAYLAIGIALGPYGLALLKESTEVDSFAEFKARVDGYPAVADAIVCLGIFALADGAGANVPYQDVQQC